MSSCIGWLFDISIEYDQAILWIKTLDRPILKLIDSYQPGFYILPRNESDGLQLFQILTQQSIVAKVRWEDDKFTNLLDHDCTTKKKKLICIYPQSTQYYAPILKILEKDQRVKQLFNTELSHIQQYLFTKLKIEPTSKVEVEYEGNKILRISKIDDEQEVSPPPFSLLYFDVETFSGKITSEDPIRMISARFDDVDEKEEHVSFQSNEENTILQDFSNYVIAKDPDILICMSESESKIFHYLFTRAKKLGLNLQLGRETADDDIMNLKHPVPQWIKGRICLESSDGGGVRINVAQQPTLDSFEFVGLIERSRFGFVPLRLAARYGINRLIDSRNCYELIQGGFVISKKNSATNNNNHERIRTLEELVSRDKGGMIISPQIGLHENVVALDYDGEYANLIVNHNLSYETVTLQQEKGLGVVVQEQSNDNKKGLLPTVVEKFLKRRLYFKRLLKELPKESMESLWCEQRVNSLKNILVCLYGTTGSIWNRYGNVLAFEEINKISREILIKTKDIVQQLGYELVYADTDSVFIKRKDAAATTDDETTKTRAEYEQVIDILSQETGLSISIDYNYKFLVLLALEADENIEALKHYYGITQHGELVVRGIEIRRHDIPNFIKQFQTELLYTLFNCKDSAEVVSKGYENCLLLVTTAIDKIMTGEEMEQQDLVISKLLGQDIEKYRSLFAHVSAAIQLSNHGDNHPRKGDTIQYIYTNSHHNNPLCRVVPLEILQKERMKQGTLNYYDKDKYKEMILDAAETVLKFLGFDRTVYENPRNNRKKKKWYDELRDERTKDIRAEMMMEKQ